MADFGHYETPLECVLCFEPYNNYSRPCVILCARGHSSCGPCGQRVRNCPTCRDPLLAPGGVRNRALMNIIASEELKETSYTDRIDIGGDFFFSSLCHRGHQMRPCVNKKSNGGLSLSCSSCLSNDIQSRHEYYQCSGCGVSLCLRCFSNSPASLMEQSSFHLCSHRTDLKKLERIDDRRDRTCNVCYQQVEGMLVSCSRCDDLNLCSLCFKTSCCKGHPLAHAAGSSDAICALCSNRSTAISDILYLRCISCQYSICTACAFC
jgi:hypothetical protein